MARFNGIIFYIMTNDSTVQYITAHYAVANDSTVKDITHITAKLYCSMYWSTPP